MDHLAEEASIRRSFSNKVLMGRNYNMNESNQEKMLSSLPNNNIGLMAPMMRFDKQTEQPGSGSKSVFAKTPSYRQEMEDETSDTVVENKHKVGSNLLGSKPLESRQLESQ